uniref:Uncharacterized protein n=1 Tax=Pseudomonas aeruginosa TaxID=287 RepID=A0A5P9WB79_PSEAI|nr:hypothetical protein pNK546KPC_0541 [Pseudomonas aeruginosa]
MVDGAIFRGGRVCQNRRRENFEVFFEPLSPDINSRYSDPKNAQSPL